MALLDQINAFMRRILPSSQTTTSDETETKVRRRGFRVADLRQQNDRRSLIEDSRQMYNEDTRPEAIIRTLAADATKGGYTVVVEDGPTAVAARRSVERLESNVDIKSRIDDWIRLTLRDGDSFLEMGVNRGKEVALVTRKPTPFMYRNSNKTDRFTEPERAFFYTEEPLLWGTPPPDSIFFAEWQMTHARWNHDEGQRYGRPLFASARTAWRRIQDGERNVAIRRKVRSGRRYQHRVEGDDAAIDAYIDMNQDALDDPFAAVQDFFGNVDIKVIDGDDSVGDINDILHHIDTFAFGSPVPLALIGYGKSLNRDILEQKLEQYERALEGVTRWGVAQILAPMIELQWLLDGIYPRNLVYHINWATKKLASAETLLAVAKAGAAFRALGWPDEQVIPILAPLIPGLNAEALLEAIKAVEENRPDEIDRIAQDAE